MFGPPSTHADVALFAHLACRPEEELDLGRAVLAIAAPEYPGLDLGAYLEELDHLAASARPEVEGVREPASAAVSLVAYLVHREGFRGNVLEYDDPRNSFLNEVLDRRLGIPISLAVVMIEVARRLRVPLHGVSFPGHFLLRAGKLEEPPLYLDPFGGRVLTEPDLAELLQRATGQRREPRPEELQVATKNAILVRMLSNLRSIYKQRGDLRRLRLTVERQEVLERGPRPRAGGGDCLN